MKEHLSKRILSLFLVLSLLVGFALPISATSAEPDPVFENSSGHASLNFEETSDFTAAVDESLAVEPEEAAYDPDEVVRVSIVLEEASTLEKGFSTMGIAQNAEAMAYRDSLKETQADMTASIEAALGQTLDVQWNLTLAANIISADVAYGDLETIQNVPGVKEVVVEIQYEPCVVDTDLGADPNTSTSSGMIGTAPAYAQGYTGAGSKVAIIDTGLDMDHQSFADSGYKFSLSMNAANAGIPVDEYIASLDLMGVEEIESVLSELNALARKKDLTAEDLFHTDKVPFGFNYVDKTATVIDHDSDAQGGHGSHVAGIAASNAYIPLEDGTFALSVEAAGSTGVAPDAQIIVMKVFGKAAGPYESDYMAAIEDAVLLGCDSVNLSLGSPAAGLSMSATYEELMDSLVQSDTVVTMSAGNSGHWADYGLHEQPGYLYAEDVNMHTGGNPGSYTNSLTVASADNVSGTGYYLAVGEHRFFYTESVFSNALIRTIAGEHEYVFLDNIGTAEDFAAVAEVLEGKIALCSRGTTSFFEKANAAVENGAIAVIIYNNQPGSINMDLTDYKYTAPVISITKEQGAMIKAASTLATTSAGVEYYTGTMTVSGGVGTILYDSEYYSMSEFSSYGVTGALELKPEITAPGGNIYSVDGEIAGGTSYISMSGTSMAAPQVAGMAAIVGQYIRENGLVEKTGLTQRALINSLLMSTAEAMEEEAGRYFPVFRQGAGLANVGAAVDANSYVIMGRDATDSWADGKIKAELKDDPQRTGLYEFTFTLNNLTDTEQQYMLSADLFTQDSFTEGEYSYMDTKTTALQAGVTWTVDGAALEPAENVDLHDVNGDGLVNTLDVQAILDYAVGAISDIDLAAADVDGNDEITTYDAYLLLNKLNSGLMTLPAGGKTEITVSIALTEAQKAELDETFVNGAYVEGFIFAKQLPTADGEIGTTHSIPMLAFYGSWLDAPMYDYADYADRVYGEYDRPYYVTGSGNYVMVQYDGSLTNYVYAGNPYHLGQEGTNVKDRWAIKTSTLLYQVNSTMIRAAGAVTVMITNQDGKVLYFGDPKSMVAAYYYPAAGAWQYTSTVYSVGGMAGKKAGSLGAREGDVLTVTKMAIPELYAGGISMTAEDFRAMVDSGMIPESACQSYTFTVDTTAPELTGVQKDLQTGDLIISAQDNNYIASVQVQSMGGTVFNYAIPEQTAPNQEGTVTIDLSEVKDLIGPECLVVLCDYAKNERAYVIEYGGEPMDPTGRMFGFTEYKYRGGGQRWMLIDPDTVWYNNQASDSYGYGGTQNMMISDLNIVAAEYVGGYVYMASVEGDFYVARQGDWNNVTLAGSYNSGPGAVSQIRDLAFNYEDNTLYALAGDNIIYTVDLNTLALTPFAQVGLKLPYEITIWDQMDGVANVSKLAIDDEGTFYVTNQSIYQQTSYLFKFTKADLEDTYVAPPDPIDPPLPIFPGLSVPNGDAAPTDAAPMRYINNLECISGDRDKFIGCEASFAGIAAYGSLAWDHDKDVLYMTCGSGYENHAYNTYLLRLDTETGLGYQTNDITGGFDVGCPSRLQCLVVGLYIVPGSESCTVEPVAEPTSIALDKSNGKGLVGAEFDLVANVFPWNTADRSVTWTSSDETIATVADGHVKLLAAGEVTITATTKAAPNLSDSIDITVDEVPDVTMTALVTDPTGTSYWSEFNLQDPTNVQYLSQEDHLYFAGTLISNGNMIMVHDDDSYYTIDPDTFEPMERTGKLGNEFRYSDSADVPKVGDKFGTSVVCLGKSGAYFQVHNFGTARMGYLNVASALNNDPMAVVAYYKTTGSETSYPYHHYMVLTEGGMMWEFRVTEYAGGSSSISYSKVGYVGLKLPGASAVASGSSASMYYDEASGYLLVAASLATGKTELYAIDPVSLIYTRIGDLGENVAPLVAMYQYQRDTELTVKITAPDQYLYMDETLQLTAKVLPVGTDSNVTWSSSDETIATVDANGLVTPVKAGTVDIIATTVATNEAGETVSGTYTVKVKDLSTLDAEVKAQVVYDDKKADWVTIDLGTLETTMDAEDTYAVHGGGVNDSKIYATDINWTGVGGRAFIVDPANGYTETPSEFTMTDTYGIVDAAAAPAMEVTLTDGSTITAFGGILGIDNIGDAKIRTDFLDMNGYVLGTGGWPLGNYWSDLCAIAYAGEGSYAGKPTRDYYLLGADGNLYFIETWFNSYDPELGWSYSMNRANLGLIGKDFGGYVNDRKMTMTYVKTDTLEGLVIGYNGDENVELYYVDLTEEVPTCGFLGELPESATISVLHTDWELNGAVTTTNEVEETAPEGFELLTEVYASMEMDETFETEATVPGGTLNSVTVAPAAVETEDDCDTAVVTMELTADNVTNNGLITVEYDAANLTLTGKSANVEFSSFLDESGKLTFGYVNGEALAKDTVLATLTFTAKADAKVTVTVKEENDTKPGTAETIDVAVPAHDYQVTDSKDATCTEDGYKTYVCDDCGETYTEVIDALGHALTDTVVAPTCTEDGYTEHTCSRCSISYRDTFVEATGHDYEAVVTAPTCTEMGYTTYTCATCGDTYKADYVDATGHDYETEVTAPTCTEMGYTTYTCACGDSYVTDYTKANGHTYGDWVVTKEATCTEKGEETRTCDCGATETREIDMVEHKYEAIVVEPTCTEAGYTEHICECGDSYITDIVDATGHEYEAIVTEPTCTEWGYTTYTCACGDSYVSEPTAPTGHSFGEWTVTVEPDCFTEGEEVRTCATCEETETRVIEASSENCPSAAFSDLDITEWYHEGVDYVLENGLMKGMSDTEFQPKGNLTRAQLVTTLYRMAGEPSVEGMENPFTDVNENDWFAAAVIWAYDAKIVNGTSDTTFAPNVAITREQIAAILYRYSGAEPVEEDYLKDFTDAAEVTPYAEDALNWAVAEGLITGMGNGKIAPTGTATRAQIATILMRYCEK